MITREREAAGWTAIFFFLLFAVLTVGPTTVVYGAGVAMVTDLQGKAAVRRDGKPQVVTILGELTPGTQVELDAGAVMVTLYLDTGDEYEFKGPAQVVFRPTQPEVVKGMAPQKRSSVLYKDRKGFRLNTANLGLAAYVMRNPDAAGIRTRSLFDTQTLDLRPEFSWQEVHPGITYQFEIRDRSGRALYEMQVSTTTLKLPPAVHLIEGAPYTWEVSARLTDGRKYSSIGDFSIAPASLRTQAETLRPDATAPVSTRVAYAAWLHEMNLKDEARKYWRALYGERPEDSTLKALASE